MIGSDTLTIPAQSQTLLGKQVSDMIGDDIQVKADGSVTGTLKNVSGFTGFSSNPDEQSGHYFPFNLTQTGTRMTLKKNGVASPDKENIAFDPELIFRVNDKNTTFTVEVDGHEVVTLSFQNATFAA